MLNPVDDILLDEIEEKPVLKTKPGFFSEIEKVPKVFMQPYYPSLDGLRAVSIILVVVFHVIIAFSHVAPALDSPVNYSFASLGVQIFFVISGFLITTLLLKEKVSKGNISLKHFYIRRFFRIVPVAYLYLVVILVLNFVLKLHLNMFITAAGFLFFRNVFEKVPMNDNITGHYWSLAVEEQFYLIFPVILKKSLRLYLYLLIFIISTSFLISLAGGDIITKLSANFYLNIIIIAISQFQGIAIGSFFSVAIFKNWISFDRTKNRFLKVSGMVLAVILLSLYTGQYFSAINFLKCLCVATVLAMNLYADNNVIFRLLNNKAMKYIGVLSFSIYIWQQPFTLGLRFFNQSSFFKRFDDKLLVDIVVMVALLVVLSIVSYVSYNFYEKRFLKLKARFK